MNKPLVSIIIVNWNGLSQMEECLDSLSKISYKNYEVIVSDNGSTDGSLQYFTKIKNKFPKLLIIKNGKNLGFAEGNNIGLENSKGTLILLLNNDVLVSPGFLEPLVKRLSIDKKVGGIQPKIMSYPKKEIIDSVGSYLLDTGFLYHFGHNKPDNPKYNKEKEIFSMKGACMLFRKSVLDRTGFFDKDYFAYFEETDLCQRIWILGYKVLYTSTSKIYHKGGETAKKLNNSFVLYHSYKNRIYTYLKNLELKTILLVLPVHLIFCELASIVYFLTFQLSAAIAIQKAIFWNLLNLRKVKKGREFINSIRKISDSSYLPKVTRRVRVSYYYHLFTTALAGYND